MLGLLGSASRVVAVLLVFAAVLLLLLACADGLGPACADACCRLTGQGSPVTMVLRRLLSRLRLLVSALSAIAERLSDSPPSLLRPTDTGMHLAPAALRI